VCFLAQYWENIFHRGRGEQQNNNDELRASSRATKDVKINHSLLCGPSSGLRMLLFISTTAEEDRVEMEEVEKGVKNLSLQHSTVFFSSVLFHHPKSAQNLMKNNGQQHKSLP
jgi:hypothetical protein